MRLDVVWRPEIWSAYQVQSLESTNSLPYAGALTGQTTACVCIPLTGIFITAIINYTRSIIRVYVFVLTVVIKSLPQFCCVTPRAVTLIDQQM
jgi:hypothetical protein